MPFASSHLRSNVCGITFRRIEEVLGDIQPTNSLDELDPVDMPERSGHGPARPQRKKQEGDALINLRKFRRIQLINRSVQGQMERALQRRLSVLSTTPQNDEFGEEFMGRQGQPTVPTLIEWEGARERGCVTGTFVE